MKRAFGILFIIMSCNNTEEVPIPEHSCIGGYCSSTDKPMDHLLKHERCKNRIVSALRQSQCGQ